jgi:hypothetical protein
MSTSRIVRRGTSAPRHATMPVPSSGKRGGGSAQIGREMRAELSAMLSGVMTAAAEAVTNATPVDTGNAAANWILSTGSPYSGVDGSRESVSEAAQVHGLDKMAKYDVGRDGRIFLVNNVPYLPDLDDGSSPQAEPGFVARAILSASKVAPRGRRAGVRKALRAMGKSALRQGK